MNKILRNTKGILLSALFLLFSHFGVFGQTFQQLFIDTTGPNAWKSGVRTGYTYNSGDSITYLLALTDGSGGFITSPASSSSSGAGICGPAPRRAFTNCFDLLVNSTSVQNLILSGTVFGTNVRTIRAIYVDNVLVDSATYVATHTFPFPNTSTTCGDIVVQGLTVPQGSTIRIIFATNSISSTPLPLKLSTITLNEPTLPVTLLGFDAVAKSSGVEILWKATNENEGKTYKVQRSNSGTEFQTLATFPVSGNGSYRYIDNTPKLGRIVYYRLEMLSIDGITTFSKVKAVNVKGDGALAAIPNPVPGSQMLITFAPVTEKSSVRIVSPSGQVLKTQPIGSFTDQALINTAGLKSGLYILQIISGKEMQTLRFVKQ